jgi:hypothetical protein
VLYDQYFIDDLKDRADLVRRSLVVWILVLVFAISGSAQEPAKAILVDEFDPRKGCETFGTRLDVLLVDVSKDVRSTAYVVVHQGPNAFDNLVVYTRAINHARYRRFPSERYSVLLTRGGSDIKVELWIGTGGEKPPYVRADLDIKIPDSTKRLKLAEDILELVKIDGRDTYIGTGNPSCLYWFNPVIIVRELLNANASFNTEFVIKTRSKSEYRKLSQLLTEEFRDDGIPIERVKFVYQGRDKKIEGGGSKLASVSTYFVRRSK